MDEHSIYIMDRRLGAFVLQRDKRGLYVHQYGEQAEGIWIIDALLSTPEATLGWVREISIWGDCDHSKDAQDTNKGGLKKNSY